MPKKSQTAQSFWTGIHEGLVIRNVFPLSFRRSGSVLQSIVFCVQAVVGASDFTLAHSVESLAACALRQRGRSRWGTFSRDYSHPAGSKCYEAQTGPESPEGSYAH